MSVWLIVTHALLVDKVQIDMQQFVSSQAQLLNCFVGTLVRMGRPYEQETPVQSVVVFPVFFFSAPSESDDWAFSFPPFGESSTNVPA